MLEYIARALTVEVSLWQYRNNTSTTIKIRKAIKKGAFVAVDPTWKLILGTERRPTTPLVSGHTQIRIGRAHLCALPCWL
jgi:hypothetical protein